ncbi:retrovirus-related pol polyprotein from transposon TNT 1-94 [Tanacetum coccineum]|uniref:Retrovirus-related pol polyprotein from transposon TNT 1-94 n=1 Tax=Tanacetum coccineum TaxID=301880 RepID=A0ABQ4X1Z7_9ASTR
MSGTIPPIPLPFGASFGNPGSPNVNRVDTMPATTDLINTTNITNVSQSVVDENLPQLPNSRGGSHITNVPAFDKEDFTSCKVRFLVFLDGLKPYLLKTLEDGPFVPMSSLSTSENPLPKRQNQWSNVESRLANQDKRLKSIIISCLPNDVMKSDSDSDVEEDQRTSNEFMADLNVEYHERALLANQKRFYKRSGRAPQMMKGAPRSGHLWQLQRMSLQLERLMQDQANRRKEKISSKEVVFTKADESSYVLAPEITSDLESECDSHKPLPPLPKLIGSSPSWPYREKMENLNEVRVKELRSNNGTKFRNHKLEEFCNEKGRSPDISYFYVFGCPVHIHNHMDHLGKFDEKVDDGFFLGYSSVAKAFRVFNIRRQEMEETVHVTFYEDDEAISQSSTEGDVINFNENRSFSDDEFLKPRSEVTQCPSNTKYFPYISAYENNTPSELPILQESVISKDPFEFTEADNHPALNEPDQIESANLFEPVEPLNNVIIKPISYVQPLLTISPSAEVILQTSVHQDRWSREKHIEIVNIIGEPLIGITTRSRIRDSDAASAFECLYVNFLFEMEPKKFIEAIEEEGWIISMQEELNQFKRNKSAFLNGKISEEVYVQQPLRFESSKYPNHVCKLDKALYGLKQAPRAWYETLSKFLIQHKFDRGTIDNTLFTYKTKSDVIIIQIYVDDIIIGSTSSKLSKQFGKLMTKKYEISMMGELTYFLGFQIKQDFKGISICQEKYIKDLLKKYDLADCASVKCPMLPPSNLGPDESGVSVNETLYQANPKESHLVAIKRIFRYLKGTLNLSLWYPKGLGFYLKAYSDSDYIRCNMDRKSTSGGCQILGGKLVCWSVKKQSSMAMSSAKVDYVAAGCCAQVL